MRRRPPGLPAWLVLVLLAFLALATVLPLRYLDRPAEGESAPQRAAGGQGAAPRPAPAGETGQLQGTKVASLLPVPPDGIRTFVGRPAFGQKLPVQSINGNEGFWVGSSEKNRVYVEWASDVGRNERTPFQPRQGGRVAVVGPVRPAPPDPARALRLNSPEAQQVLSQGAYVHANRVVPSK